MLIYMLSAEQIKLLEGYRDKAYICNILCDVSFNYYSFIKTLINLPLILSSTIMTVLNSSDFDPMTMRIPNIILNASTSLILSLINNYKLPENIKVGVYLIYLFFFLILKNFIPVNSLFIYAL